MGPQNSRAEEYVLDSLNWTAPKVYEYIQEFYHKKITLEEISSLVNMSPVSFNRFIKKRTTTAKFAFCSQGWESFEC